MPEIVVNWSARVDGQIIVEAATLEAAEAQVALMDFRTLFEHDQLIEGSSRVRAEDSYPALGVDL